MGHGHTTALDYVEGKNPLQPQSILSVKDVPKLRGGARCPVALFVTCYAGRCDGPVDGLAEELLLAEEGPVSVIAATCISMPYGNTIFSYEFLRASLGDLPATLGAAFRLGQQRTLAAGDGDAIRLSVDTTALSLSPLLPTGGERWRPGDLVTERQEHIAMYHLFGDPLLRWRRPRPLPLQVASELVVVGHTIAVEGVADFDGDCLIELVRKDGVDTSKDLDSATGVVDSQTQRVDAGPFRVSFARPQNVGEKLIVRAYLHGDAGDAVGSAQVEIRDTK